ncbi:UNVERIFIED_CONTAM: Eukaryotic translation initiation factor 2-alpha kinase 3 [Trichonephila clavipes]
MNKNELPLNVPQNIFFSIKDCVVKVGDFGLATLAHPNTDPSLTVSRHSTNLGTKPYAAPEQIHKSHYDSKGPCLIHWCAFFNPGAIDGLAG